MSRAVYRYDRPERFIAGTVGMPGERTFYLQAKDGRRVTSVALEKQQVSLLSDRIDALVDQIEASGELTAAQDPLDPDQGPLETPIVEEFRVSALGLGWDSEDGLVLIEAHAVSEDDAEPEPADAPEPSESAPDVLSVRITVAHARAFAARARAIVAAGRPPCPFCGLPLEPTGHICPRANGYRR